MTEPATPSSNRNNVFVILANGLLLWIKRIGAPARIKLIGFLAYIGAFQFDYGFDWNGSFAESSGWIRSSGPLYTIGAIILFIYMVNKDFKSLDASRKNRMDLTQMLKENNLDEESKKVIRQSIFESKDI